MMVSTFDFNLFLIIAERGRVEGKKLLDNPSGFSN